MTAVTRSGLYSAIVSLAVLCGGCDVSDADVTVDSDGAIHVDAATDAVIRQDGALGDVPDVMVRRDGGRVTPDAGTVTPDAGMVTPDAGMVTPDAGMHQAGVILDLVAMDLWAQPLPVDGYTLTVTLADEPIALLHGDNGAWRVSLQETGTYGISLNAPGHRPLRVSVTFDGTTLMNGVTVTRGAGAAGAGVVLSHGHTEVDGETVTVHTLWLGARHNWFSAQGRPARRGNTLRLMMDGEEAWSTVAQDLRAARNTVHVATWWWESDFELVRDAMTHPGSSEAARRANTVLSILERSTARKRVIVGQFLGMDGVASTVSSDAELRAHGTQSGDGFEYMGQANPTHGMFHWQARGVHFGERVQSTVGSTALRFDADPLIDSELAPREVDLTYWPVTIDLNHASYHQKFMVLDDRVAFIGGMNLRRVDWDTSRHVVFEPRRMLFGSTTAQRAAVVAHDHLPDNGPRKDYMVRIEGPSVRDAEDVFHERWRYLLDTHARYSEDASDFTVPVPGRENAGGVQAQVTATLPEPFSENAIAETLFNAVEQARDYIYIEDQYFRVPMLTDVIYRRMDEVPGLRLVVITKPVNEWTDPGCAWTYRTHQRFRSRFAGRYMLLQLRAFDIQRTWGIDETESRFVDMDTHSKMMIVDDVFLSVGSANKNNRGLIYEGELNVAVYDPTWVHAARRRVMANLLGVASVPDDSAGWWAAIAATVRANDAVRQRWSDEGDDISLDGAPLPVQYTPRGFVYTLDPGPPADCLIETIGPDVV